MDGTTAGPLDRWVAELSAELGIDVDVDVRLLLEVARDAAHQVDRPAAPLTTFLVGYAAALRTAANPSEPSSAAVEEAAARAQQLAARWTPPES